MLSRRPVLSSAEPAKQDLSWGAEGQKRGRKDTPLSGTEDLCGGFTEGSQRSTVPLAGMVDGVSESVFLSSGRPPTAMIGLTLRHCEINYTSNTFR